MNKRNFDFCVKNMAMKKELSSEQRLFLEQESAFLALHKNDTNLELLEYVKKCAEEIGRRPTKADIVGYMYIKSRLGTWHRVLEQAGLKEKSAKQLLKEQKQESIQRKIEKRMKKPKYKNKT